METKVPDGEEANTGPERWMLLRGQGKPNMSIVPDGQEADICPERWMLLRGHGKPNMGIVPDGQETDSGSGR